jgi:hypothetical protein
MANKKPKIKHGENVGIAAGAAEASAKYGENVILGAERGHGFAAEKANHLFDKFSGRDAHNIGVDNAKNGADRLVDGIQIQTKYCATGSKCISECFDENGIFRYVTSDGKPMQIEVPSDSYEAAIQAMEERIKKGKINGVNDPKMAREIVRKGHFTYEQARNIAKAGTIESLTYDAANGIKLAGTAAGISAAITFALAIWNGDDWDVALKSSAYSGLKVGGIAWLGSIITAQLGRTGVEQSLRTSTDWLVQQIGYKAASAIATSLRSGNAIYGQAAMNHVSKLLRGNIVTAAVTTLVLSSVDIYRIFNGKISKSQLFKNVSNTAVGVAGGVAGWQAGAVGGATAGTAIFPGPGTAIGGFVGGLLGGVLAGWGAQAASSAVLNRFIKEDADEMLEILEKVFADIAQENLLGKSEMEKVIDNLKKLDLVDKLRDMFASDAREVFAKKLLLPLIENVTKSRVKILLPSDDQLLHAAGKIIEEIAGEDDMTLQPV